MDKLFLRVAALLLVLVAPALSHEIHLQNGNIIKNVEWVKEEDGLVRYGIYGGTMALSKDVIREIVYSDGRKKKEAEARNAPQSTASAPDEDDLAARLFANLQPKTAIEKANLATVAIQSELALGSGFFVSADGYIVTNRHVVRGDEEGDRAEAENLAGLARELADYEETMQKERYRLAKFQESLGRDWNLYRQQASQGRSSVDRQYLAARKADLDGRNATLTDWRARLAEKEANLQSQKQELAQRQQALRERQEKFALLNSFEVILADNTTLYASFVNASQVHDLALLKVSGYQTPYLIAGRSADEAQGAPVYAIGSPIRMKNSVTSGVLSGFRDNFIQTNAQIYPGNSGGPLINEKGEVIGINTMKLITDKFEGLGFAINIETALAEFANYLHDE